MDEVASGGQPQQRSFNLLRLRAIESQRNLAATSFDAELHQLQDEQDSSASSVLTTNANEQQPLRLRSEADLDRFLTDRSNSQRSREDDLLSPAKIDLRLDPLDFQAPRGMPPRRRPRFVWDETAFEADDEADWCFFSLADAEAEAKALYRPNRGQHYYSRRKSRQRSTTTLATSGLLASKSAAAASKEAILPEAVVDVKLDPSAALSVRGLHLGRRR